MFYLVEKTVKMWLVAQSQITKTKKNSSQIYGRIHILFKGNLVNWTTINLKENFLKRSIILSDITCMENIKIGWLPAASGIPDCTSRPHQPTCRLPNGVVTVFKARCQELSSRTLLHWQILNINAFHASFHDFIARQSDVHYVIYICQDVLQLSSLRCFFPPFPQPHSPRSIQLELLWLTTMQVGTLRANHCISPKWHSWIGVLIVHL